MRRAEMVASLVILLLGAFVVQQSTALAYQEQYGPGPGFLPFWLGWGFIGLSLLHVGNLMMQPDLYQGPHPFPTGWGALRPAALLAVLLASIFVLGSLGLLFSIVALSLVVLLVIERKPWRVSVVATVVIGLTFYCLFAVALRIPFPRGPLEAILGL